MNKPVILVVEDEALLAADLVDILSSLGYMVHEPVATGEDAIRAVKNQKPDLVLMDIQLIGAMNGIEAAEKIRAIANIPIVYLTAYTDDLRLKQAQLTEPYGYIVKPVHSRELHATIQMALYKHGLDRKLKESEEKFRAIFAAARDGIIVMDLETHRYVMANAAIQNQLGYTGTELLALSITDIHPPADLSHVIKQFENHVCGETSLSSDIPLLRKDGTVFFADINSSRVTLGDRQYMLGIFRDITHRKNAEEVLRQVNKQLSLLSSITRHDILSQVMMLKKYIELSREYLGDNNLLGDFLEEEDKAARNIEHQITFTRDYQEMGITAPAWQNANKCIRNAIEALPMRAVRVEPDPANLEVYADFLIEKVFYNLIDNALKYGGDDMKTIRFSSQESDAGLMIICENDGVGISDEDKKHLFTRGFGKNTGLGLFLSREILAITGIKITENGTPGKGARFEITVPIGAWRIT